MEITGKTAAEIFDSIRALAQSGNPAPGQALPTVRELAGRLGVNRNTVALAYRKLVTAGIATTQGRRGTVIRRQPALGEREGAQPDSPLIDLGGGNPNPVWLPDIGAALAHCRYRHRLYGAATVDPALARHAHAWLDRDCPAPAEIELTHGAVDAVERLLAAHLTRGDRVAVEDPCFVSSLNTLRIAGLQPAAVAVDRHGMRPDRLEHALAQGARAVIVTPRAHNPTGCSLTAARAAALRAVLARYPQVLVIVDDHFFRLAEAGYHNVLPANARRWALVRSVSKMLGPDLRLAFVASDRDTAQRLRLRLAPGADWVSHLLQDAVCACLSSPAVARQIDAARTDYARRRAMLADALTRYGLTPAGPAEGLSLWLPLPGDSQPLGRALARDGWLVRSGEPFAVDTPAHGLRITVSTLDAAAADRFARTLQQRLHANRPHGTD